jgi:hypothetical protein
VQGKHVAVAKECGVVHGRRREEHEEQRHRRSLVLNRIATPGYHLIPIVGGREEHLNHTTAEPRAKVPWVGSHAERRITPLTRNRI